MLPSSDEPHISRGLHARFPVREAVQGKDIARVLGAGQRGNGCYSGAGVVVTWCIGHLVEAVPPEGYGEQYKRWAIEQLPILPDVGVSSPRRRPQRNSSSCSCSSPRRASWLIATDADREGEMIAREIIDLCGYRGPIQRLWLSALNDASIRKALGRSSRPPRRCHCISPHSPDRAPTG